MGWNFVAVAYVAFNKMSHCSKLLMLMSHCYKMSHCSKLLMLMSHCYKMSHIVLMTHCSKYDKMSHCSKWWDGDGDSEGDGDGKGDGVAVPLAVT